MLSTLGHPQPPTPLKTDNKTASSFANDTLQAKRSKSWDMRYFWIKDKISNGEFIVYWEQGLSNFADYFTKHFPPSHHQRLRSTYVLKGHCITLPITSWESHVRGCVDPIPRLDMGFILDMSSQDSNSIPDSKSTYLNLQKYPHT